MKIRSIDHIVIVSSDVERTIEFYCGLLGMSLDESAGRVVLKFGSSKINIHRFAGEFLPAAKEPTVGSADICLIVDGDIAHVREELARKGVKFELDLVDRTGALGAIKSLYLRDPDGNLVELGSYKF